VNTSRDAKANDEERRQQIAGLGQELNNAEGELSGIRRECAQLDLELQHRQEDLRKHKNSIRDLKLEIEV
jgi:chromosome segregation ATPase